jgi:HAMP domain-containing protein
LTDAGGQIIGLLHVTRRGEDFDNYLARLRLGALALLLMAGGLMAAILFFGHHRAVGRHVQDMCEAMAQVACGAHAHRVPVKGPGELRMLADGVNGMLDAMEQSREEIERRRQAELQLRAQLSQAEKLAAIGHIEAGDDARLQHGSPHSLWRRARKGAFDAGQGPAPAFEAC